MEHDLHIEYPVPSGVLRGIKFNILSESDAAKISAKVIELVNEVTDPALGLPNPVSECRTCGAKDVKGCEGHFGLIKFPFTIISPYFISEAARILNKICPGCKSARCDKVKRVDSTSMRQQHGNCKYCDGTLKDYPQMRFRLSPKDMFGKPAIIAEVSEKLLRKFPNTTSGGSLASDYWDIIPHDAGQDESSRQSKKRVLSYAQVYSLLKDVDSRLLEAFLKSRTSIFLSCFLLTPNCHRVTELGPHMLFDESNRLYRKLIDFRGAANDLSMHVIDRIKLSKLRAERQAIIDPAISTSGLKFLKELLIAKRSNHAFRLVVVGDPQIKLSEIGIPCHVAESLHVAEHLNTWNSEKLTEHCDLMILQKGWVLVRRNDGLVRVSMLDKLQKGDTIYRPLVDGDIVLINRPPSIHQHSLIALSVRILPITSALSINPLICSPLRGDFDGDCLHGYVPQSMDCRVELRELVALDKQLLDGQSGRNLLSLSHDSLTAAHLILEDGVLLNQCQMQQLQMSCPRQFSLPAIFKALSKGSCYWTGKQLFSLLLPSDFDYFFPSNGVCIRKGEIMSSNGSSWLRDTDGNLFRSLVKHYGDQVLHFLFAAQEVLCEWLSMRGLSVSLSDLYLSSDPSTRKNMVTEISCGLKEAERLSYVTLLMVDYTRDFLVGRSEGNQNSKIFDVERLSIEKQKSAALSQASVCAFKDVFWDIQNLLYQYANKGNSFLAMLKAGSKGNLLKLVQQSMCLGLQHSLIPLSFQIPHHLSCGAWNDEKNHPHDIMEYSGTYIPCAVVENSFLTGLNPLECFVHSLTTRESSFSGHADVSGTLTRKLTFFMRDLYIGYDGTVRNPYGNQVVQFSYYSREKSDPTIAPEDVGGHPVGSLAASAISEAAYSALDQPISALESSPLLNLKKVLESGVRKSSGEKSASMFLSKMLGRWAYGFEYGALEVKNHLERLLFSDLVSEVMICFSRETSRSSRTSPWVCHFHINKEIAKRRRLKLESITDALNMSYTATKVKAKVELPNLQITCTDCCVADTSKQDPKSCITVAIVGITKDSYPELDILRDFVIPFLLRTVVKGFSAFKKVDILWREEAPILSKSSIRSSGELYLRVLMSENCDRTKFWSVLVDSCLQIMTMIDWERSHPDDIHDISVAYGIDVAWKCFLRDLSSAVSDTGKIILPEHLVLATDCLSSSGQFLALSAKGLSFQRKENGVSTPFTQACFSSPGESFLKAAKMGLSDDLRGTAEALSWGKIPPVGTGFQFDVLYSGKGFEPSETTDVYNLLGKHAALQKEKMMLYPEESKEIVSKPLAQRLCKYGDFYSEGENSLLPKAISSSFTLNDIQRLSKALRNILYTYDINDHLKEADKSVVMRALYFHPRRSEKIGTGAHEIKVGQHKGHANSRCFLLVRSDGTVEDFSYHKCVHHALKLIAPKKAKTYHSRWLNGY
ncbi:PREDICTED: DNA-directed RNA polymerase IV subunit 1 isoform X2 [Ipomoea nil]|uniref:DNA-directed RNA polymerase IV subunit 1 isoform X2 n=1 Tax=Ipomoea nil TaxID=35883 RepID=UPI0009009FDD|nr:PREDICTED: DNA-directed RNA polymerase IV subunit 1 isoform X2 [Ipomoea nil]